MIAPARRVIRLVLLGVTACAGEKPESLQKLVPPPAAAVPTVAAAPTTAKAILGIWWSANQPQSAAFQVKDSTIYYPDSFNEFRYEVRGDTLLVHRDDGVAVSLIVKLTPDTLILSLFERQDTLTRAEPRTP